MNNAVMHTATQMAPTILQLDDVRVRFPISNDWLGRPRGYAHALNGIDLQVQAGETLGIVGESGCGKSTLAQLLMGLVPPSSGELNWAGRSGGEGSSNVQIVFQDPQSSLDPRLPVWKIITEPLYARGHASRAQMRDVAARVAAQVGIRPEYLDRFPTSFPVVSDSGSPLPEPFHQTRILLSWTSRHRRWTFRFRHRSLTFWRSYNALAT